MTNITKTIGDFQIVAEQEPISRGYMNPEGKSIASEELFKDDVFYEQDYFEIFYVNKHYVMNAQKEIVTPIIDQLDVLNKGYVCTWNSKFWIQGFAVIDNQVYFVEKGDEESYYKRIPKIYQLPIEFHPGVLVDWESFKSKLSNPLDFSERIDLNVNSWVDNAISEYML
jgi:hypothetical protein